MGPFMTRRQSRAERGLCVRLLCAKDFQVGESAAKAVGVVLLWSDTGSLDMQSYAGGAKATVELR